jgi:hypothetical protein
MNPVYLKWQCRFFRPAFCVFGPDTHLYRMNYSLKDNTRIEKKGTMMYRFFITTCNGIGRQPYNHELT